MSAPVPSPRLSIGVPVYNGEAFLRQTLESILAQSFTAFELIISDNASTDATQSIGREYASRDPRVQYHRNSENVGLARNYTRHFSRARGVYFKWASADDLLLPGYLERCVAILDRDPDIVLVYPQTRFVDAKGSVLDILDPGWNLMSDLAHERLRYVVTSAHWVNSILGVIRSSALAKTRLLPGYPGGDYCVLGELSLMGKFYEIAEPLYQRRIHPGSSSQHQNEARVIAEYWQGKGASVPMAQWSRSFDHFRTLMGSPLGPRAKLSVSLSLLRAMYWRRQRLWHEIRRAAGLGIGREDAPENGRAKSAADAGREPEARAGEVSAPRAADEAHRVESDAQDGDAPRARRA